MQKIKRAIHSLVLERLKTNPAVALLGPRQVGKSTLAKMILSEFPASVYLDLELDSDRLKVESDPERFFEVNQGKLICLDEVQLLPEIFKVLRGVIDKAEKNTQFLILGSASRDLIRQSSESLAGRISYVEVKPFDWSESKSQGTLYNYWDRGGYPRSLLAASDEASFVWRDDYIRSFLERDLPQLGFSIPSLTLKKFWVMLAHSHGQLLNASKLGQALGVSSMTISKYIDILEQTFIIRSLKPFHTNEKKRLVKSPKVYIRDTGLLHALLRLDTIEEVFSHPVSGVSFESLVIENILIKYPRHEPYFYRDSTGNEVDLVLVKGPSIIAIEIKATKAPKLESGFWKSVKFLKPDEKWVICQVDSPFPGKDGVEFVNLESFLKRFEGERGPLDDM